MYRRETRLRWGMDDGLESVVCESILSIEDYIFRAACEPNTNTLLADAGDGSGKEDAAAEDSCYVAAQNQHWSKLPD